MNREKFKSIVLYICNRVSDPSKLGSTKLNKILYYSDFINYLKTGASITGETYVKRQHGPVPNDILKIESELIDEEMLLKKDKEHFGYIQKQYFALIEPSLDNFTASEISLVDEIIEIITENHSASTISDLTHNHIWDSAALGQEIPYETAFVNQLGEIDDTDISWANCIIESREAEKASA